MKHKEFLSRIQDDQIVAAIRKAEGATSGEIRVFVSRRKPADAVAAAQREFTRLGMVQTQQRHGVLLYVAPRARKFAIIGDQGIHQHCGQDFWCQVADEISGHFRQGQFTTGIVHGVTKAGELLARHFPRQPDDKNELPDAIAHD